MMNIISDELFKQAVVGAELEKYVSSELYSISSINKNLQKYLLLNHYPEKFSVNYSLLEIYYNKYYWYLKFLVQYKLTKGYDAGIEQQESMILEEGESYPNIDWQLLEQISNEIKKEV